MKWLSTIFEPYTAPRCVGKFRLLILDGHGSHATPEFDQFCKDSSIITLCIPAHSSHLLQPLDVGCFSVLKRSYRREVAEIIRLGINHVDKREFLSALKVARKDALSASNIASGFAATGIVPFNPEMVLSTIQIRPYTPPDQLLSEHPDRAIETPHNLAQLEHQVAALKQYLKRRSNSPPTPTDRALNQLVKGCQMAMQSGVLLAAENERLRAANEKQKHRRGLKRRFISTSTSLNVSEASTFYHLLRCRRLLSMSRVMKPISLM